MKKLVCNLIIMGALAISTHSQAQHLLEALDAPDGITDDLGRPYPGNPGGGTGGSRNQCIAQGYTWVGSSDRLRSECYCPKNGEYNGEPAQWNGTSWVCIPKDIGKKPDHNLPDPPRCVMDCPDKP